MKIAIDGKFYGQKITGVQRFAREILSHLDALCEGEDVELVVPAEAEVNVPAFKNIRTVVRGKKASTLWEQTTFARYVRKSKRVALCLCNAAPLFARKIVCVHDVKICAHPEFFSKKFRLWYSILLKNITKKADVILTVSEFSKSEIEKYYPRAAGKIRVVGNAWQHFENCPARADVAERYGVREGEYFFALSSIEPNKNLKWIIETAKNNPRDTFLVAGSVNKKVFAETFDETPENVRLLGYVPDEDAKGLMQHCKAFLFVTLYEGFGLPPLEALSAGAPCVIVSDSEVMHEVLGGDAVYVLPDRYDYDLSTLSAPHAALSCLDKYSWEKSAERIFDILKEVPSRR